MCPFLTFLPNTKRGSGDRERGGGIAKLKGVQNSNERRGWKPELFEENQHVILHDFFELQYVSVAFSTVPLLSVSLLHTLSLFLSLTPSLSLFGHSDVRFTASLTDAAGEFPCAFWSLIRPKSLLLLLMCSETEDDTLSTSVALFFKSTEIFCHFESEIIHQ